MRNTRAVFELHASDVTRDMWPNEFTCVYSVTLDNNGRLGTTMTVRNDNTDGRSFDFTTAVHTYALCSSVVFAHFSSFARHSFLLLLGCTPRVATLHCQTFTVRASSD